MHIILHLNKIIYLNNILFAGFVLRGPVNQCPFEIHCKFWLRLIDTKLLEKIETMMIKLNPKKFLTVLQSFKYNMYYLQSIQLKPDTVLHHKSTGLTPGKQKTFHRTIFKHVYYKLLNLKPSKFHKFKCQSDSSRAFFPITNGRTPYNI